MATHSFSCVFKEIRASCRAGGDLVRAGFPLAVGLLLAMSACGKSRGSAIQPLPGLETPFSAFVHGTSGLPAILADLTSAVRAVETRASKDDLGHGEPGLSQALASEAGWRALGVDPRGEVAVVFDQRLATVGEEDLGFAPLLILKIDDRAKLVDGLKKAGLVFELGAEDGGVTPIVFDTRPVAYAATLGERTVIAFGLQEAAIKDGLRRFVAGGGDRLDGSASFASTMKNGPGGAGAYAWLSDMDKSEALAEMLDVRRRHRRTFADVAKQFVSAIGLRVSQQGMSLRLLPTPAMKDLVIKAYSGTRSPRDIGTLLPPRGWAAARMSIDPKEALPLILTRMGEVLDEGRADLGRMGISLDEVISALSGDIAVAVDVQSAVLAKTMRGTPRLLFMVGISDADKARKLVESMVGVVEQMGATKRRFEAAGETAWELKSESDDPVVVAVTDDMVIIAQSEAVLVDALERRKGDNLAKTAEGTVLRERLAFAAVADLAPLVALLEGDVWGSKKPWRGERAFALGVQAMSGWKALRERPFVTAKLGVDDDVVFATVSDGGLTYGAVLGLMAGEVVRERVNRRENLSGPVSRFQTEPSSFVGESLGVPTCDKYLATMEKCFANLPEDARRPASEAIKQTSDAWREASDKVALEVACKSAWDAAKQGLEAMCPDVIWE